MNRSSIAVLVFVIPSIAISIRPGLAAETTLEEIVVTAQRREESAQKAALAISVVTPQALANAGVTSPIELTKVVPALQVSPAANTYAVVNIRGIANYAVNSWSDPAVVISYDGIPIARSSGIYGHFYDLERIEVLKGPQGTLYGRNATGGAINILPKRPELGWFGGDVTAEIGNYDLRHFTGALNVPVGEKVALRGAFDIMDRDGYYSTGTGDNVGEAGRLQILLEPTDKLSVNIGADYYHQGGRGPGSALIHGQYLPGTHAPGVTGTPDPQMGQLVYPSDPWTDVNDPRVCAVTAAYYSYDPSVCIVKSDVDNKFWGIDATINYDLDFATVTVIPAYRRSEIDLDGYNIPTLHQRDDETQTSVEARLASNNTGESRLNWIVGGFWMNNPNTGVFGVNTRPSTATDVNFITDFDTTSWAAFGQATYSVAPWARVAGGIRYTHDEKTFGLDTLTGSFALGFPPGTPLAPSQDLAKTWSAVTWMTRVEFDVADDSLVHFGYERGYHSGGFFTNLLPTDSSYKPETVQAYTVGSKNLFLDRRLQANVEGFYYLYTDQQISHNSAAAVALPGGGFFPLVGFVTQNVGKSKIWGVELDMAYKVAENTLLTADVQWIRAKYESFVYSAGVGQVSTGCDLLSVTPSGLPFPVNNNYTYDCSGRSMVNTPTWKYTVGLQQTIPLGNGGSVVGTFNAYGQSAAWLSGYDYLPYDRDENNWSGDIDLAYHAPDDRWSLTAFVRNVSNEVNISNIYGNGDAESAAPGTSGYPPSAFLKPPRTYGIRASVHF